jgi:dipeptidase E
MKLFLTSAGLTTDTLRTAFRALLPSNPRVAFVPTAARLYQDTSWLEADIGNIRAADVEVDLVDISLAPKSAWLEAFNTADAICFGGGNTYFLLDWIRRCGLAEMLPALLKSRVYMGISAGSMVAGPSVESNSPIFPEEDEGKIDDLRGLSLVPFAVVPHLNSAMFSNARDEHVHRFANSVTYPVYALDDQSAIEVTDGKTRVVSSGDYKAYNK